MDNSRSIRYEERFEREAAAVEPNAVQRDEIFQGVEWDLARDPSIGERVGYTDVWAITTRPFVNRQEQVVELVIYYRFTDDMVTMLSVIQVVLDW